MYDELKLHQTYTNGDYFHLDIELKWLRGMRLHRNVRFKFFRDKDVAGLEFRSIAEWPVVFQVWPSHLTDNFGPYFVISTGDAHRKAIAQLDPDGLMLVSDIAAELFTIISSLTHNPAAEITDVQSLLREAIRISDYIDSGGPNGLTLSAHGASVAAAPQGHALSATATVDRVPRSMPESTHPQYRTTTLRLIAATLSAYQRMLSELRAATEKEVGVLESYLAKIRLDGVPKHIAMKQKLDEVAENNIAILILIKAYAPHAKTATFTSQSDQFRSYASAWRDRWNAVLELVTAGGSYATAEIPFPNDFAATVEAELAT